MNEQDTTAMPGTEAKTTIEEAVIVTDKDIIEDLNIPFIPVDERVLIKPMKPIMITKTHDVIDEAKTKQPKGPKDIGKLKTKTVTEEVEANLRVGVVLAIGEGDYKRTPDKTIPYEIGDKVVYVHKAAMPFELFKDTVLVRKYEILGKWVGEIK